MNNDVIFPSRDRRRFMGKGIKGLKLEHRDLGRGEQPRSKGEPAALGIAVIHIVGTGIVIN